MPSGVPPVAYVNRKASTRAPPSSIRFRWPHPIPEDVAEATGTIPPVDGGVGGVVRVGGVVVCADDSVDGGGWARVAPAPALTAALSSVGDTTIDRVLEAPYNRQCQGLRTLSPPPV
jgi:hypothetical protein